MKKALFAIALAFSLSLATGRSRGAELQPKTLEAWNNYVKSAQEQLKARLGSSGNFLWMDEDPARASRVNQGRIEIAPTTGRGAIAVPSGLIHDWIGAAFIPGTSLDQVMLVVRDYDHYKEFFNPEVASSKLIARSLGGDEFSMRVVNKVFFVSTGIDGEYRSQNVRVDSCRLYSTSYTTKIREIQNYGESTERELAPDQGDGYIWRLYSITRFEERDGGVYVEMEAIALTRDIPGSVRFLITPVIKKLSKNSLMVSLQKTRDAVRSVNEVAAHSSAPRQSGQNVPSSQLQSLSFQH